MRWKSCGEMPPRNATHPTEHHGEEISQHRVRQERTAGEQARSANEFLLDLCHRGGAVVDHGHDGAVWVAEARPMAGIQRDGGSGPNQARHPQREHCELVFHRGGPRQPVWGAIAAPAVASAVCGRRCLHEHSRRRGVPNRLERTPGASRV